MPFAESQLSSKPTTNLPMQQQRQPPPPISKKPPRPNVTAKLREETTPQRENVNLVGVVTSSLEKGSYQASESTNVVTTATQSPSSIKPNLVSGIVDPKEINVNLKENATNKNKETGHRKDTPETLTVPKKCLARHSTSEIVRQAAWKKKSETANTKTTPSNIDTLEELKALRSSNSNNKNRTMPPKTEKRDKNKYKQQQQHSLQDVLKTLQEATSKSSNTFNDDLHIVTEETAPDSSILKQDLHVKTTTQTHILRDDLHVKKETKSLDANKLKEGLHVRKDQTLNSTPTRTVDKKIAAATQPKVGGKLKQMETLHKIQKGLTKNEHQNITEEETRFDDENSVWLLIALVMSFEAELPSHFFELLTNQRDFRELLSSVDFTRTVIEMLTKMYT